MTVRELSSVLPSCRFFRFSIYNSARFVYISFTFSFTLFFLFCLPKSTPRHFYLATNGMNGKSLILNGFFLPKRLPKLATLATKMASP